MWGSLRLAPITSLFKKWDSQCQERGRDPIRGPIAHVLNFLAELFDQDYQYGSLNSYRSAISSVHQKVDGIHGNPLIDRMLKGFLTKDLQDQSMNLSGKWIRY